MQQVSSARARGSSSPTALSAGSSALSFCLTLPSSSMASMQWVHQVAVGLQDLILLPLVTYIVEKLTRKLLRFCFSYLNHFLQIYFYTNYLFQQAGIPSENIPYVTIGTGACECITALTSVSICVFGLFFSFCSSNGANVRKRKTSK